MPNAPDKAKLTAKATPRRSVTKSVVSEAPKKSANTATRKAPTKTAATPKAKPARKPTAARTASVTQSKHVPQPSVATSTAILDQVLANEPSPDLVVSENAPNVIIEPLADVAAVTAIPAPDEDVGLTASISQDSRDLSPGEDILEELLKEEAPGLNDDESSEAIDEDSIDYDELRMKLMVLQQQIHAANIPVVIVFEGWDAAGKGTMLSKLIDGLDPRGYQVYPIRKPSVEDTRYPLMRRYWVDMPVAGNISLFCSSWYREVSLACFENKSARKHLNQTYQDIISMESPLVSDGVLLIKLFLHIPRKEQKRRLKELESKKSTRWRVDKEDWRQNERYEEHLRLFDAMIARTHFEGALWHVLRSDNKRVCIKQLYDIVIAEFQAALADRQQGKRIWDTPFLPHLESMPTITFPQLDTFDPEQALIDPYKPAIDKAQKTMHRLQNELYLRGIPMVICFEGWDAAGKGGAIRRLTSSLDPRGFDVVPIAAPTQLEKGHHHLWRFWQALPADGHIAVFDRTWYGRVMVERVEGYCTEPQWKRAYEEINRFESELAAHGTVIVKFWLQIDSETQLTRFNDRETSTDKQWKITPEDWRNREKWPAYEVAVNDMLQKTNTTYAPWTVVEGNNKQYARLKVLQSVIRAVEERLETEKA